MAKNKNGWVDPLTYAKNIAKSAKYIAVETAKGVNPTLTNYISDNAGYAKDMYNAVKDYKGTIRKKLEDSIGSKNTDSLSGIKDSIFEDIKTGKFYNPEREAKALDNLMESWGMSSFDFDMDDDDFDFDDDDSSSSSKSSSNDSYNGAAATVSAIHGLGNQLSYHQLLTSEGVANKIAGGASKNTKYMLLNNERLFGVVNNSLSVINTSILDFHNDIINPLNSHIQNSTTFYQTATTELSKQTSYLENITKLLTDRFAPIQENKAKSIKRTPWETIMGGDMPDLKEWAKFAKDKAMEEFGMDEAGAILNPEMLETLLSAGMSSPIALVLSMALTSKIQNGPTGKALDRTVNIFRDGMMKAAGKISKVAKSNDGILGTIASFFDITPKLKAKMNFGNYNKGRVDWTGKDDKALREVIPTYLANIEALLSGREAKVYNYETGRFVSASKSLNEFKSARDAAIGNASKGMKDEIINDFISEDKAKHKDQEGYIEYTKDSRAVRSLSDDYDRLMSMLTLKHVSPERFTKAEELINFCKQNGWIGSEADQSKYVMSSKNISTIARLIFRKKSGIGKMYNGIYSGQIAHARFMNDINETNPMFGTIANGSGLTNTHKLGSNINKPDNSIIGSIDDHGNNVFFYLQDYYKQIRVMVDSVSAANFSLSAIKNEIVNNVNNFKSNRAKASDRGRKSKASSRGSRTSTADAGAGGSDVAPSLYGFNYDIPNNIAPEINNPEASSGASGRDFSENEDPEGRMVYNSSTKQYEAPKVSSRGSFLKFKDKSEHSLLSLAIDKVNDFMDNIVFGDATNTLRSQIEQEGGLIGFLQTLPNKIVTGIQELPDKIAAKSKELWEKFKESDFGSKFIDNFTHIFKSFVKDTEEYAQRKAEGTFSYIFKGTKYDKSKNKKEEDTDKTDASTMDPSKLLSNITSDSTTEDTSNDETANPEGSYKGGLVKKSGMVSVSQGELIIPAKYNPLYHGGLSDKQRKTLEKRNYKTWRKAGGSGKFFGMFAEGGTVEDNSISDEQANIILNGFKGGKSDSEIAKDTGIEEKIILDMRVEYEKDKLNASVESIKKNFNTVVRIAKKVGSKAADAARKTDFGQAVEHGAKYIYHRSKQTADYLFGDSSKYKDLKKTGGEIIRAAKEDLPKTVAAGAMGGLVGAALTGSGLGLLGGMAIGAGSVVLQNSSALSEALFGKYDELEQVYKNGILPDSVSKFIKQKLPDVGKAGALGGLLGTIGVAPGGIFGGMVLGAGLELVSGTETFQTAMFGPKDINGERQGGIMGSIKAHVIDPIINATDAGIEHVKKFFKENIFTPLENLFNPLVDWFKGKSKSIAIGMIDGAKEVVSRTIGEKFDTIFQPIVGATKAVSKFALGKAEGLVSLPFKAVDAAGTALKRHNINKGYSTLSAEERDRLTHDEDFNTRRFFVGKRKVKPSELTEWELKFKEGESRNQVIEDANMYLNTPTELKNKKHKVRQDLRDVITASMPGGGVGSKENRKRARDLVRLMNSDEVVNGNDYSKVIDYVNSIDGIGEEEKKKLVERINESSKRVTDYDDKIANFAANKEKFFKDNGLDISKMSKKELRRTRVQLGIDAENVRKSKLEEEKKKLADARAKDAKTAKLKEDAEANPLDAERNSILKDIKTGIDFIADWYHGKWDEKDAARKATKENTGEENFETPVMSNEEAKKEESLIPSVVKDDVEKTSVNPDDIIGGPKKTGFANQEDIDNAVDTESTDMSEDNSTEPAKSNWIADKARNAKAGFDRATSYVTGKAKAGFNFIKNQANDAVNSGKLAEGIDNATITVETIKEILNMYKAGISARLISSKLMIPIETVKKIISNNRAKVPKAFDFLKSKDSSKPVEEGGDAEGANGDSSDGTKTVMDDEGNSVQYKRNAKGEWVANLSDAATNTAIKTKKKAADLKNKFFGMFVNGGILGKLKDLLVPQKEEEKKKSIFDIIKDKLGDAATAIGGVVQNVLGSTLGSSVTSFLGSLGKDIIANLPSILGTAATIAGLTWLGGKAAGTDNDSGMRKGMDAEARKAEVDNMGIYGKTKLGMDAIETKLTGKKMTTYEQDDHVTEMTSSRMEKRFVKNALMSFNPGLASAGAAAGGLISKIPIVGKTFGTPLKASSKFAEISGKVGKAFSGKNMIIDPDKATTADKGLQVVSNISSKILGSVKQVLKLVTKKLGGDSQWVDNAAEAISNAIGKAGSKVSGALTKISGVIYIAQIALAVEDGFEDARAMSILGIIEKPSLGEKCLAAACNGINYAIPGIGGIIGTSTIFNIVFNVLSKFIKFGTLATKRAEAQETVKQYNEETGHTYDVEEYIYNVLNMSTTQDKVKSWAKNTVGKVKDTITDIKNGDLTVGQAFKKAGTGIVNTAKSAGSWVADKAKSAVNALDKTKVGHVVVSGVSKVAKAAGEKVSAGVDYVKDAVSAFNKMQDTLKATFKSKDTTFADMVNTHVDIDEDNPLSGFTKGVGEVSKIVMIPSLYIGAIGRKLFNDVLKPTGESLLQAGSDTLATLKSDADLALHGDLIGLWKNSTTASQDNDMWFIPGMANLVGKITMTGPAAIFGVAKQAWGVIKGIGEGISAAIGVLGNSYNAASDFCKSGDLIGLWSKTDSSEEGESTLGGIISATSDSIMKVALTVPTIGNFIGQKISGLFSGIADAMPDVGQMVSDLWDYTSADKDMKDFDQTVESYKNTGDGAFNFIGNGITSVVGGVMNIAVSFLRPFMVLGSKLSGAVNGLKSWANDKLTKFKNWLNGDDDDEKTGSGSEATGSGSGIHTNQKGNFTKFGNSTIDQDGCGPAVASTVLKAFGKKSNINDTAKYAEKMGYVAGSTKSDRGTRASYFGDILGKNGINTSYTDNQSDINNAINSGKPTILLGEDSKNNSKSNSPFGPNPHYVVARGTDNNGNVIVDDPELKGTALYKKNILKHTKLGVVTGGASGASDIINSGLSAGFNAMADNTSGPMSSIIKTIFGGFNSSSSTDSSTFDSSSSGGYTYTGDSPFPIVTSKPTANDPYISYYNNSSNGGQSTCITGNPKDSVCNVLCNCVGWVCGRFNHIYSVLTGDKTMKYKAYHANAGEMYDLASKYGLQTGSTPQAGAIMVWGKNGGAGHVAIVEKVVSADEVLTSESGYNSYAFKNKSRKKGNDGKWGAGSAYYFKGFVYNPAVQQYYASHPVGASAGSYGENAKTVWNILKKKGMSDTGIAGLMGCWKNESNFNPINLENKFEKKYGNDQQYTAYVDQNNAWPDSPTDHVGYGLAQWTGANGNATSGNRKHNLLAFAKSKGTSVGNLNTQVEFAYDELKNSGKYDKAYNNLMSASTPEDAAAVALGNYEMPGWGIDRAKRDTKYYPNRKKAAVEIYNQFHNNATGSGSAIDMLDQEARQIEASRGSGARSNKPIPIAYDFTSPKNNKNAAIKVIRKAMSRGSASDIPVAEVQTSGMNTEQLLNAIITYLQQISTNTAYSSSLPAIASILNGIVGNMGSLTKLAAGNTSGTNTNATEIQDNIEQALQVMKSKIEALASTP